MTTGATAHTSSMDAADWPAVRAIYATGIATGIATGHATFEDSPPTWEQFHAAKLADHRLTARLPQDGANPIVGWTAVTPPALMRPAVVHSHAP